MEEKIIISKIDEIIQRHKDYQDGDDVTKILDDVQKELRFLPRGGLKRISEKMDISLAKLYGPATFFSNKYTFVRIGKNTIKICTSSSCYVHKSMDIYNAVRSELNLTGEDMTTDDMMFTVEAVPCMGRCGEPPVIEVNGEICTNMTVENTLALIRNIIDESER